MSEENKTEEILEEAVETAETIEPEEKTEISKEEELSQKLTEAEDKYLRLYAEFDNFKKRSQKEKNARYADAVIDTVLELLPVLDNLDRALMAEATSEDAKSIKTGVEMIKKQMIDSLGKLKVTEIKAVGEEFNPNLHDAVMHAEDDAFGENTVCEEFMKGYIYNNERVVRHSMVKVAN